MSVAIAVIIFILLNDLQGYAQILSCDPDLSNNVVCPGSIVKCTCTVLEPKFYTDWTFSNLSVCNSSMIRLAQFYTGNAYSGTCGDYLTANNTCPPIEGSNCTTSILTVIADISLDGLGIECRDSNGPSPSPVAMKISKVDRPPENCEATASPSSERALCEIQITWTTVGCNVTKYAIKVDGDGTVVHSNNSNCSTASCNYQQQVPGNYSNYTIFVAPIIGNGTIGEECSTQSITCAEANSSEQTNSYSIIIGVAVSLVVVVVMVILGVFILWLFCKGREHGYRPNQKAAVQNGKESMGMQPDVIVVADGLDEDIASVGHVKDDGANIVYNKGHVKDDGAYIDDNKDEQRDGPRKRVLGGKKRNEVQKVTIS